MAYPEEGWTYDDMLEIAKKLQFPESSTESASQPATRTRPMCFMTLSPIVWSYGADFLNEDQTECTLNTPEAMEAVRFFTGLYTTEKVTPEGVINYTMTKDIMPLFIENKVGMMMGGDQNAVGDNPLSGPEIRILCASQISGQLRRMDVHSSYTAKNPDAAF